MKNISDKMIVLSRSDYGERDRILNVLTASHGKLSVLAKGVRSQKSKLAGGIELFAENAVVLHSSKSDLYILTSAKMERYFGKIAKDVEKTGFVYECLKLINKLVPTGSGSEYFLALKNLLYTLDKTSIPLLQVKIWFWLKVLNNTGSSPNFKTDEKGKKLVEGQKFSFDHDKQCFIARNNGSYSSDHIKLLRHLAAADKPKMIGNVDEKLMKDVEELANNLVKTHLG